MKSYIKPLIFLNEELAEGIYAASGSGEEESKAAYRLAPTNAWDGHRQYNITLTNNGSSKVDSISVTLTARGNVTAITGNVSGTISGNKVVITCNNYGNGFASGESGTFFMEAAGSGEFSLE